MSSLRPSPRRAFTFLRSESPCQWGQKLQVQCALACADGTRFSPPREGIECMSDTTMVMISAGRSQCAWSRTSLGVCFQPFVGQLGATWTAFLCPNPWQCARSPIIRFRNPSPESEPPTHTAAPATEGLPVHLSTPSWPPPIADWQARCSALSASEFAHPVEKLVFADTFETGKTPAVEDEDGARKARAVTMR